MTIDQKVCGNELPDHAIVVDAQGRLANAVVVLTGVKPVNSPDFARFLTYARGSLAELSSQLEILQRMQIGSPADHLELSHLIARCSIATARLQAYLRTQRRR